jgi:hypothetical protein
MDIVAIGLAAMAVTFAVLHSAAVGAALATAASWALAAAPFVLIGGLIAGILLVMNSIRRWKEGKQSAFGDFADQIASWLKPAKNDPWWLTAIKELVGYMAKALGIADRLGLAADKASENETGTQKATRIVKGVGGTALEGAEHASAYVYGKIGSAIGLPEFEYKKRMDARSAAAKEGGEGFFGQAKAALGFGQYGNAEVPQPEARAGTGGANVTVNAPLNMNVSQSPGESGTDFADRVSSQINDHLQSTLQEANAAVSR